MAEFLLDVRCRGCRRQLGVAKSDNPIFCDVRCAEDFPATSSEARDALVYAVWLEGGHTFADMGDMFMFSRQWAQRLVSARSARQTHDSVKK